MWWLIALLIVILLVLLPVSVDAAYDQNGVTVFLGIGFLRVRLYPRSSRVKKRKNTSAKVSVQEGTQGKRNGGRLSDFISIANLVIDFLEDFRRRLRIRNLEFKVILADDDPCDLSVQYGLGWALLGNLMPRLEQFFVIQKRNLEVECDYTATEKYLQAHIDIAISLGRLLWIVLWHGPRILRKYNFIVKQTKGGNIS